MLDALLWLIGIWAWCGLWAAIYLHVATNAAEFERPWHWQIIRLGPIAWVLILYFAFRKTQRCRRSKPV